MGGRISPPRPPIPVEQKARLDEALRKAGVEHVIETCPACHDFVPSGTPAHDAAAADRRWRTLLELLDRRLKAHP